MENDKLWKEIDVMNSKQWVMTSISDCSEGINIGKYNLVGCHLWGLMATKQLKDGTKLLKLRNPWGYSIYNGPYSFDKLTDDQRD